MPSLPISIGLVLALSFSASLAAAEPTWQPYDNFDQGLTFELPCASAEVEIVEQGSLEVGGKKREISCTKDGVAFRITVAEFPVQVSDKALFDDFSKRLFSAPEQGVKPVSLSISGRRTAADRGELGKLIGQRALIEINPTKVALIMVGGDPAIGPELEMQRRMIDRFFVSLRVQG
jgi:hypothetical protein